MMSIIGNAIMVGGGSSPTLKWKDVNFIDYDGTLLYSYPATEFQQLSELPATVSDTKLTSTGWNYTLSEAKAQVTAMGECLIGQNRYFVDNVIKMIIKLEEGQLSPYCCFEAKPSGVPISVDIDWGDGSTPQSVSLSSEKGYQHQYSKPGEYIITIIPATNKHVSARCYGSSPYNNYSTNAYVCALLSQHINSSSYACRNQFYASAIQEVYVGQGNAISGLPRCNNVTKVAMPIVLSSGAYMFCNNLKSIVVSTTQASINTSSCYGCSSLQHVSIPANVTSIGNYAFYNCFSLKHIILPHGLTSIGNYAFYNANLTSITIPETVTSIENYAFYHTTASSGNTTTPAFIKFKSTTPPTLGGSAVFGTSRSGDYQINPITIYVPSGSLSAYTSATNYPSNNYFTYVEY